LKALREIYPFFKVQRCIVHKLRNVAIKLKWMHLKPCMAEAKDILNAPSRRDAIRRFKVCQKKWQVEEERAVRCMEKEPIPLSPLLLVPHGAVEEDTHHQYSGAGLPGGEKTNQAHGLLPPRGKRPEDLLGSDQKYK